MADKSSSSDDGPRDPKDAPKREGNPWERQRDFNSQRRAVLRPRDAEGASTGGARPDDTGDESRGGEQPADAPVDLKSRMSEYRRRQSTTPRPTTEPTTEPSRAPAGGPATSDDDEAS
jgi:hypothetical protein